MRLPLQAAAVNLSLNFHDWRPMDAGGENGNIGPDPLNPAWCSAAQWRGRISVTKEVQELPPTLAHPGKYRSTWTLPLVFSPIDPHGCISVRKFCFERGW